MPRRIARWLHEQFVKPHTWRDEDIEYWWQMPDDRTRVTSPWLQLAVDAVARATFSQWHQDVAETRVRNYDRLRPTVTRGVSLAVVGIGLAVLAAPWWCWLLAAPALLQVTLELVQYRYLQDSAPEPKWRLIRWMRDVADENYWTVLLNVTGMVGVVACPALVFAIAMAPVGGADGWVKVVGLAAAVFYVNSGVASTFLDPPNYRETSTMPPVMHWVRPFVPLVSSATVLTIVAISVRAARWEPAMVPLAFACVGLTLLLGSTIRNHDRVVAAGASVARKAVEAGRRELGVIVHDDLGPIKQAVDSAANKAHGLTLQERTDLHTMSAILTHFATRTGLYAAPLLDLKAVVRKVGSAYGLAGRATTFDIRWNPADMHRDDTRTAIRMATALIHNVGQALSTERFLDVPKSIVIEAYTTGEDRDLRYHLAVRDRLPLIDPDQWCADGTSLAELRKWLRGAFNGDLVQEPVDEGSKRIVASWADRPPLRGYALSRGVSQ